MAYMYHGISIRVIRFVRQLSDYCAKVTKIYLFDTHSCKKVRMRV